ncbi:hypothetical protein A2631_03845 [Candidatus Daviesbacteria bacterium RIFCSPHIGHO2_01_FULL_44_29]|nr:MAG: hypothetical protein A2631_03845 [Candidatus Daviesbacteria bacterium RIFCSPHIGHO2_01_FULL_44_29]
MLPTPERRAYMIKKKSKIYQIDQSGKIEQTERHTVLACTNGSSTTILLKKAEKRKLQKLFKTVGIQKLFPYLTFAALLAVLIKVFKPKYKLVIDREYQGHENLIEDKLKVYLEDLGVKQAVHIEFDHVGKLSNAHNLAYQTAMSKRKPDIMVGANEVMKIILGTKKVGSA